MGLIENKFLYSLVLILSLSFPLIRSFEQKLKFASNIKAILISCFFMMMIFIPWDILFTKIDVWSFNSEYITGFKIFLLPIEEWMFFIIIPYCCLFIHESLILIRGISPVREKIYVNTSFVVAIVFLVIAITNSDKFYTLSSFGLASVLLFLFSFKKYKWFYNFLRTYLFSLIALVVVNGVLTGSFIENEIVSYNENHFMGYRIFTIPIEDTIYCFSMLFIVTGIYEKLKN